MNKLIFLIVFLVATALFFNIQNDKKNKVSEKVEKLEVPITPPTVTSSKNINYKIYMIMETTSRMKVLDSFTTGG